MKARTTTVTGKKSIYTLLRPKYNILNQYNALITVIYHQYSVVYTLMGHQYIYEVSVSLLWAVAMDASFPGRSKMAVVRG